MDDDYCRTCEPHIESRPHPQSQSGAHLPYCTKHNRWLAEPTLSDMKDWKTTTMAKPKQYKACGQNVDRATFRSLLIQSQAKRLLEEFEEDNPKSRKGSTYKEDAMWNSILEMRKVVKEMAERLRAWAKQEKDVDLADYWKED